MGTPHHTSHPTVPTVPDHRFIHGDIVAMHRSHRIAGTVDTVGRRFVNVVTRTGHRVYRAWQLDRVA